MSLEDLHQRYLWIAKNSLQFLKEKGFQKKGLKYFKQKGDFILKIYPIVPRPWINTENSYKFTMVWEICSLDSKLIRLSIFMGANKNIKDVCMLDLSITPNYPKQTIVFLTDNDPPDFDQKYVENVRSVIEKAVLPLFDQINSLDDVIHLAEEEAKLEKEKREFFQYAISDSLAMFYAYKGWKDKALEMCDKAIEETPATARHLAEEDKKKYISYFKQMEETS